MKTSNSKSNLTRKAKVFVLIIITVLIGLLIKGYGLHLIEKTKQQVIESAVLIESNDEGYVLSFEGEEHFYTFD